jgi:outer membrane receptor for ferrienterochelin and colicin
MKTTAGFSLRCFLFVVLALLVHGMASAQVSRATISGTTAPNAVITATNTASGFVTRTTANGTGSYTLANIAPGTYRIDVDAGAAGSASRTVSVQVGQSATLALPVSTAPPQTLGAITVTAQSLVETRTSEVAQNITRKQIETLPQNERNFLDFAKLVPGVTVSRDPNQKTFSAGGQSAENVNVFIDGASLRNDILKGGLVGQDSSRGNPFSQEAIAEYRVLTQNYKAEYEDAGTAIITAITKSGTNEFHGSVYDYFQNSGMISQDSFDKKNHVKKPDYRRQQRGFSLGGPIIKDKLNFYFNFDQRKDTGAQTVQINDPRFAQFNGTFPAPFDEKTYFGKLSWHPNENNDIDLSYTHRLDSEVLGFGGNTAYTARQIRDNRVTDMLLKWQARGDIWTNDFLLDNGKYSWSPHSANPDVVQEVFDPGIAVIGGASGLQSKSQKQITVRDDVTFSGLSWHGDHTVKMGIKYADYRIHLLQNNNAVPTYFFQQGDAFPGGFDSPYRAVYSPFGASLRVSDIQYGAFVQDDWDVNERLQLNLGVRWDYDSNALNNGYVTPLAQYATLQFLGLQNNISTGHERKPYKHEIQPRFGFSYDVSKDADQSTTIFGGAGRYYSRTPYDWISQEAIHAAVPFYTFNFSPANADGTPVLPGTIPWDPSFLTAAGLDQLLASGVPGFTSEIDALNNDTKPPYTDQFSLGLRQVFANQWTASLTLSRILGYRQFTWVWNREVVPGFVLNQLPGSPYGVVLHNVYKKTQDSSVLVSIEKPYTETSGWGLGIAYTYQRAHQNGNDNYSLDYVDPAGYPYDNVGEKHHLVINGIVRGPWDTRLSGIFTYGSGLPYDAFQPSPTCDYNCVYLPRAFYGQKYVNLDLSVAKDFRWGQSQALELRFDVLNVFNRDVDNGYINNIFDPEFGKATSADPNQTRRFQVGVRYSF